MNVVSYLDVTTTDAFVKALADLAPAITEALTLADAFVDAIEYVLESTLQDIDFVALARARTDAPGFVSAEAVSLASFHIIEDDLEYVNKLVAVLERALVYTKIGA